MSEILKRLPLQTVSLSEKLKEDKLWARNTIDHLCFYADGYTDANGADYTRMLSNYQLYNNILNQKDFENECNPFGLSVAEFKDEIKPYNKSYNKIQVLLGEELKRKMNYRAILTNSGGIKKKQQKKTELMHEWFESTIEREKQRIMEKYQQKNPMQDLKDMPSDEAQRIQEEYQSQMQSSVNKVMDPKEIEKYMNTDYQEGREILAQKVINYTTRSQNLKEKKNDGFKHACISGKEFVWVGVENGEPVCRILNSLNVFYHKSPEIKYVQNGEYAGYRTRMTPSEIVTKFSTKLTKEEKDRIQGEGSGVNGLIGSNVKMMSKDMDYSGSSVDLEYEYQKNEVADTHEGSYGSARGEDWEVTHVEWISQAKVGILTYFDEDGEEDYDLVSEDFPIPANSEKDVTQIREGLKHTLYRFPNGQTLEWVWIPEVWEGTRIGFDIYVNVRKKPNQHRSVENPWQVHLGYHGVVYNNMNAPSMSLMDRMKPFQYLYFLVVHKLKRLIARDKGQAYTFDTSTVDEKLGLEKTIYYLEELDIHFFNSLENAESPGASQRGNFTNTLNRSNMQHIMNYINLLQQLDVEIGDAAGVTKQREGQIGTYEGVTNAQQSIMQSSHITEIFFYTHSRLWEKVMTSLVECAQEAWKDSKVTKQFVLDDLSRQILDFEGKYFYNADIGVFISDDMADTQLIDTLKQMALPILQNQGKITDIVRVYKSLSGAELEQEFKQEERDRERKEQQAQEQQNQLQQQQLQAQKEMQERTFQHEKDLESMKTEREIMKAEIDVFKFQQDLDANNDGIPDPLQIERLRTEAEYKSKKLAQDKEVHKDKMEIERKKLSSKNKTK